MAKIIIDNQQQQDAPPPPASKSTQLTWVSGLEKQRKKRFSSKVKTGCETCKKRRVKCDEGKPACANCNRSGRRCEGYQSANLGIYWFEHDGKGGSKKPVASTRAGSEILFGGSGGEDVGGGQKLLKRVDLKYGRDGDKAFLDLFLEKTAVQLVKFSNPYFWYTLVPQASWSHEGIRHGVAAVGLACHEHDFPETKAVSRQTQSIYHYNAAIRALTTTHGRAEATPPDVMLICCVLFWLFENLKNRPCIAMTHLKAAVNMLNERSRPSASREDLVSMYIEPLLQEGMVFAATVLPTGGRQRHEAPATMSAFVSAMNNLQPSSSPKDLHAVRYDFLRCQEGLVIAAKMQMSASSPDPDLSLVRKLYSDWSQALDNNAHKWPADYVRMLRMHYASQKAALDILEANMLNPENFHSVRDTPEWRSRVQWILSEARYFAHLKQQETNNCAGPNEPIINMSLITLLSITARQSTKNNGDQAEEAISLMQEFEWFEGIWNSKVAGEVVRLMRKVDAEHEFCQKL